MSPQAHSLCFSSCSFVALFRISFLAFAKSLAIFEAEFLSIGVFA